MTKPKLKYDPTTGVTRIDGCIVIDASEDLVVDLRGVRPRNAVRGDQRQCAFSKAAKKVLSAKDVIASRKNTYLRYHDYYVRYMTPVALRIHEEVFDHGGKFFDGVYTLKAPSRSTALEFGRERMRKRRAEEKANPTKRDNQADVPYSHRISPWLRPRI